LTPTLTVARSKHRGDDEAPHPRRPRRAPRGARGTGDPPRARPGPSRRRASRRDAPIPRG